MECVIGGKTFRYAENAIQNDIDRDSYFELTKKVFGLDFYPWYRSGFCGNSFVPHTLYHNDIAVASVGVMVSEFKWKNCIKTYVQISTVITDPEYRSVNLSRWLMELVLKEWKCKSDLIYLYANDSVVDFYPKFGFDRVNEYVYSMPVSKRAGKCRKLDLASSGDMALLTEKYLSCNNPFSALTMEKNLSHVMFHCVTFLHDNVYYVEDCDAVVIAEYEKDTIFCYDIYSDTKCSIRDVIGILAAENTTTVNFGFTPNVIDGCRCEKSEERDTTVFALKGMDNIFANHKVTFPFLSRA